MFFFSSKKSEDTDVLKKVKALGMTEASRTILAEARQLAMKAEATSDAEEKRRLEADARQRLEQGRRLLSQAKAQAAP